MKRKYLRYYGRIIHLPPTLQEIDYGSGGADPLNFAKVSMTHWPPIVVGDSGEVEGSKQMRQEWGNEISTKAKEAHPNCKHWISEGSGDRIDTDRLEYYFDSRRRMFFETRPIDEGLGQALLENARLKDLIRETFNGISAMKHISPEAYSKFFQEVSK